MASIIKKCNKCGGTNHQRSNSRLCPYNKKRQANATSRRLPVDASWQQVETGKQLKLLHYKVFKKQALDLRAFNHL